jgi:glycosyltransferase involved in cell wall biosynthesis
MAVPTVSVLITTYYGERPERLARSLESMYGQTVPADELVLVVDGPIDIDQEAVITHYVLDRRIPQTRVVRLSINSGLGNALAVGQDCCSGDWIMRMDSDDVAVPDRTEAQLAYLREHPDVDLIGGWAEEFFDDSPETRLKTAPADPVALVRTLRWRNVIVHPSVMIRTSALRQVGGFRGRFVYLEDWDLFVRLALARAKFAVLPRVLVRVNTSRAQAGRRGGWQYVRSDVRFRTFCWRSGFLRFREYAVITPAFIGYRLAGGLVRDQLYRFVRS